MSDVVSRISMSSSSKEGYTTVSIGCLQFVLKIKKKISLIPSVHVHIEKMLRVEKWMTDFECGV